VWEVSLCSPVHEVLGTTQGWAVMEVWKPRWFSGNSWKFHAVVIATTVAVCTPIVVFLMIDAGIDYPLPLLLLMVITNITNLLALSYSVYVYSMYDKARTQAVERLKREGVEVVSLEEGISQILTKTKPLMGWMEEHEDSIKEIVERAKGVDIEAIVRFIDDTNEIYDAIRGKYSKDDIKQLIMDMKDIKETEKWLKR